MSLLSIAKEHRGNVSDKWTSYFSAYDELLQRYRNLPIRILEIGIQNGGSLALWAKYFPNATLIVGCDIEPKCAALTYDDPRVHVIVGDANSVEVEARIAELSSSYDIVIDDGSHRSSDIIHTFALYFPRLSEGGLFVAEDLHCSYFADHEGGMFAPFSSMSFFRRLADYVNRDHWGADVAIAKPIEYFAAKWNTTFDEASLSLIQSVQFQNSICAIRKGVPGENQLGLRYVSGQIALVEPVVQQAHQSLNQCPDQSGNIWGPNSTASEYVLDRSHADAVTLASLKAQLAAMESKVWELNKRLVAAQSSGQSLQRELTHTAATLSNTQQLLERTRKHPVRALGFLLQYKSFKGLSVLSRPISKKLATKLSKQAKLRDPRRTTIGRSVGVKRYPVVPIASTKERLLRETSARFDFASASPASVGGEIRFSILVPVYNTPPLLLKRCIETVLGQTYRDWDLHLIDDGSTLPHIQEILNEYAQRDSRVFVHTSERNRGIAEATQIGVKAAKGTHISLLDHDDELTFDALAVVAATLTQWPNTAAVYSDECKLDVAGQVVEIFAKPDWSPSLMTSCMYMGHLTTYRRDAIEAVGGFRKEFDFSQDYDVALRVTELDSNVRHISQVLYGWRAIPESAAAGGKPYARQSNIAALQAAATRRGWHARAVAAPSSNVLSWETMATLPLVSIIVPSDNQQNIVACVSSLIEATQYKAIEILVVTNSDIIKALAERKWGASVRLIAFDKKFNFSEKCNVGAAAATGDFFVFYNDDVFVKSNDWVERLLEVFAMGPAIGAVGPKLVYEDDSIQHAGMVTGVRRLVGTAFHGLPSATDAHYCFAQSLREVSLLCGACLIVSKNCFDQIGGFDAVNTPIYHSDVDLCFKIRSQGYTCVYTPHATLLHIGHVSLAAEEKQAPKHVRLKKDKAGPYLLKKWPHLTAYDPYFTKPMRELLYHDSPDSFMIYPGRETTGVSKKDVLLVSHDLTGSGAPRVVLEIAKALLRQQYFVVVTAPSDGAMRAEFEAIGVTVIVDELLLTQHESVLHFAKDFDLVIANTIVTWPIVRLLKDVVPVAWYIHEIDLVQHLAAKEPGVVAALGEASTVWAGSELAACGIRRHRSDVSVFEYGLEPLHRQQALSVQPIVRASVFGSYEPRKGQDLLAEAFSRLDTAEQSILQISFIGRALDESFKATLVERYAKESKLKFCGEVDFTEYQHLLLASDLVIVPSRSDTLPLVSLNALSAGIPLLCTRETGTSDYLVHGESGFIASRADANALAEALRKALRMRSSWQAIGAKGADIFERFFSMQAFESKLIVETLRLTNAQAVSLRQ